MTQMTEKERNKVESYLNENKFYNKHYPLFKDFPHVTKEGLKDKVKELLDRFKRDRVIPSKKHPFEWQVMYYISNSLRYRVAEMKHVERLKDSRRTQKDYIEAFDLHLSEVETKLEKVSVMKKEIQMIESELKKEAKIITERLKPFNIKFDFETRGDSNGNLLEKKLLISSYWNVEVDEIIEISEKLLSESFLKKLGNFKLSDRENKSHTVLWLEDVLERVNEEDHQVAIDNLVKVLNFVRLLPIDNIYSIVKKSKALQGKDFGEYKYHSFID